MTDFPEINLLVAWLWIFAGFVSGALMGLRFQDPNWFGGYASHPRRMYRLGHISFFGLGMMNFLFYLTAEKFGGITTQGIVASAGFILGAITMPICCAVMARKPKLQFLFSIPVTALLAGAGLTILELLR